MSSPPTTKGTNMNLVEITDTTTMMVTNKATNLAPDRHLTHLPEENP